MATFWKGFGIFWIIFLIWYLTGGPQRGAKSVIMTNEIGNVSASSQKSTQDTGGMQTFSDMPTSASSPSDSQTQSASDKSFSSQPKINTINLDN